MQLSRIHSLRASYAHAIIYSMLSFRINSTRHDFEATDTEISKSPLLLGRIGPKVGTCHFGQERFCRFFALNCLLTEGNDGAFWRLATIGESSDANCLQQERVEIRSVENRANALSTLTGRSPLGQWKKIRVVIFFRWHTGTPMIRRR